jgi:hypothetical protein
LINKADVVQLVERHFRKVDIEGSSPSIGSKLYFNMKDFYREFKNKKEREEYSLICRLIWGGLPLDIDWAVKTKPYEQAKESLDELEEKTFDNLAIKLKK